MYIRILTALILTFFLFSCQSNATCFSTIVFISDTKVELEIKDPIDGNPNSFYVTQKIQLEPNVPISYKAKVTDFAFLNVESQQMQIKYSLLLLEGCSLTVNYLNGETVLSGDNAEGIEYLYKNYRKKGLGFYVNLLVPLMESQISDSINFIALDKEMEVWRENLQYKKDLLDLLNNVSST